MKTQIVISGLAVAFLILNSPVLAVERLVPSQYSTIQAAIDDCNNGDVVIAEPNIYTGSGNKDIDFKGLAITVRSTDPNDPAVVAATVIDCENSGRGFYFHSGETSSSVVAGFTIVNGYATQGGGIRCSDGSSPTITHCNITNNVAHSGGAIYCMGNCGPLIHNCVIMGNSVTYGSGLFFQDNCNATVTNCIISNNVSIKGSAIFCKQHSSPLIRNCVITGNSQQLWRALYFWDHCNATVSNCTIWGNSRSGIYSDFFCNLTVNNCILYSLESGTWYPSSVTVSYSNI
jgi:predicted outer membrane repeat protein